MDDSRIALEADYRVALIGALRQTASGTWGLFGHNPKDRAAEARAAPVIAGLVETGAAVDAARETLDMEPFDLHRQFLAARGPVESSAVGEPKQARAWLDRLEAEGGA